MFTASINKHITDGENWIDLAQNRDQFSASVKNIINVRFEAFTAVTMKNVVVWDINPSSYLTGDTLGLCYRAQPDNAT
jgi:hypothetical protein